MPEVIDAPQNASVEEVREAMMDVVDPELGVNIVDLGLVYGLTVEDDGTAVLRVRDPAGSLFRIQQPTD